MQHKQIDAMKMDCILGHIVKGIRMTGTTHLGGLSMRSRKIQQATEKVWV